jgi:hypothetical protein
MTQCLQDMAIYTIEDYTNLLITPPESIKNYEHSGTKIEMFEKNSLVFYSRFYCEYVFK